MKWLLVSNASSTLHEYHLIENNECKVILKYNPLHHSARITCGKHHKLIFVETTGSLKLKTVFKNEYGLEVGSLHQDKWHNKGSVVIDDKKYNYQLQNNPLAELIIYNNNPSTPLVSCGLKPDNGATEISLSHNTNGIDNSFLLLGLCWYLFLPVAKENVVEYAL
ncbi:hypothetical protein ACQ33O_03480 [Ferruginibacter sp. SUN002]|uniref:hypothetical protein n=1 Tax=Ferruginibacter sp. SUN002 TaxID=2937789 RepID=UPI003D36B077